MLGAGGLCIQACCHGEGSICVPAIILVVSCALLPVDSVKL